MLVPVNIDEIPKATRKHHGKYVDIIDDFIESGIPAAEYVIDDGKAPLYVNRALFLAVQRNNYPVQICRRKDRIFIIRKEEN